ncbi:MAG: TIGR03435 family protein [Acidobacteriaceae bacterium]
MPIIGFAQTTANAPSAAPGSAIAAPVVADVHPSAHSFYSTYLRVVSPAKGRYVLHQATLLDMIVTAYGAEPANVVGGPPWLDFDRFDVTLQVPADATQEGANLALRALLAERFRLVAHPNVKPLPAYVMRAGASAPRLKPAADPSGNPDCQYHMPASPPQPGGPFPTTFTFSCRSMTMERYAQTLRTMSWPAPDRPIIDATGLKGAWDFDVTFGLKPNGQGLAIFDGVEKQLGLKIEAGTAPQPVVLVESAIEQPTPNPPGLEKVLPPPPPPAFDVAVIKPSAQQAGDFNIRREANQVTITNTSLQTLIAYAWDISGAMIANGPAGYAKQRWDIVAKTSVEPPPPDSPGGPRTMTVEDLRAMLRTLLADRFQLKSHIENHPAPAYTLYASGPKMKKADPANRTSCKDGPGADGKDPRRTNPVLSELVSCQNITIAQFAAELQTHALDYIKTPVLDATHLDGNYDFTLSFSTSRAARGVVPAPAAADAPPGGAPADSDPTGAISLPDALSKQLGLKLALETRPVPMLVIDHLEDKPTDN